MIFPANQLMVQKPSLLNQSHGQY